MDIGTRVIKKKPIVFRACEFKELSLNNSIFSESIKFEEETKIKYLHVNLSEFKKYFFMQNCIIKNISLWKNKFKNRCYFVDSNFGYKDKVNKAELNFSNAHFEDNAYFNNSEFYNYADFHECKFEDNAYFNNSHFKDYVDFCECEFDNIACFYGVKFDKTPNFSQAIFKGNLNVVNTNLNFTFDNLEEKIKQEYGSYKSQRIAKEAGVIPNLYQEKSLDKFANDFRDSFRNFKSTLIKDNNLLDASNFHKYELYCKELELKNKKDKTLKDRIDKWQLSFYRKLCDHHTDLLLNLKWLVVLIGSFALLYFTSCVIQDINLLKVLNQYGVCLSIIGVFSLFCLYWFECIKKFDFFVYLNLNVVLWVVCYKPKIIFGIVNIISGKSYNGFENALITIYTILLALVLFSLQKTARKNSIVPS